ncbi:MAG: hypothetical protein WCC51_14115, partial [Stenotrophomonas indicatrix]
MDHATVAARRAIVRPYGLADGGCMPVALALLFVVCHGLAVAFWPGPAGGSSFVFLTAAPLLAAAACLWRG